MALPRSLREVVLKAIRGELSEVYTTLPGKVVSYDAASNLADVELAVKPSIWDDDNRRTFDEVPILPAIPVQWPRFNGYMVAGALAVGDTVAVHFCSDGIGEWRVSGDVPSEPVDPRRLSIGYPFCTPGLSPDTDPPGDASARQAGLVIGKEGSDEQIRISAGNVQVGATGALPVSLSAKVDAALSALSTLAGALSTYTGAIQGIADPGNLATPVIQTALVALQTAIAANTPTATTLFKAK